MVYGGLQEMASDRYEIRLDSEHRRKLKELAMVRDAPASEVVREMIDEAYEEDVLRERRKAAARRIAELEVEDVPDPETLSRQLASTYDSPDIP
jgi:predicted transcriptional regulator